MFNAKPSDGGVWITGASEGIGKAVAQAFAEAGYTVYGSARSGEKLEELAQQAKGPGNIVPVVLDVRDTKACADCVQRVVNETGALSMCILNAGIFKPVHGKHLDLETFKSMIDVNLYGVLNGLVPAVEAMKEKGQGQVAIVSSVAGYGGLPKNSAYGLTKAGLVNMAESLKFDFDKCNIKLQIINPGFIDTPLTRKNEFPMPFLMDVEKAAKRVVQGMKGKSFEITFPRRFTYLLKFINLWCYPVYFRVIKIITG